MPLTKYVYDLEKCGWSSVKKGLQESYHLDPDSTTFIFISPGEGSANQVDIGDESTSQDGLPPEVLGLGNIESVGLEELYEDKEFWEDFFRQTSLFTFRELLAYIFTNSSGREDQIVEAIQSEFSDIREELARSVQSAVTHANQDIEQKLQPFFQELQKFTQKNFSEDIFHSEEFREVSQKADQIISYLEQMREQHVESAIRPGGEDRELEKWRDKAESTKNKLDQLRSHYHRLKENYEKLYDKHEKMIKKYRGAKNKMQKANELQSLLEKEQERNRELKEDLEALNKNRSEEMDNFSHEFAGAETEEESESTESLSLETHSLNHESSENINTSEEEPSGRDETEKSILTGEYFEIKNEKKWYVRSFSDPGPYYLTEMLKFKENDEIDLDSLVRDQDKGVWRRVTDYVELCAPLHIENDTGSEGEKKERYFIKRSSYRVPFYEVVSLEIGDEIIRGYCTSLSLGGCFIELSKLNEGLIEKGVRGVVSFQEGALGGDFSCEVEIMNVHQRKPRGVGLMFHGLSSLGMKFIGEYVEQHFLRKNRAA